MGSSDAPVLEDCTAAIVGICNCGGNDQVSKFIVVHGAENAQIYRRYEKESDWERLHNVFMYKIDNIIIVVRISHLNLILELTGLSLSVRTPPWLRFV